jgi:hypothetical protein
MHLRGPGLMATSLLLSACEHRLATRVPVSESGEPLPTSVAFRMDESAEVLLSLPRGATTSEIAFVRAEDGEVCFDVLLRTWAGADRTFEVLVNVDEWNAYDGTWSLRDCEDHACLPSDTQVRSRAGDGVLELLVRGGRYCVQGPRPRRALSVELVQGAASIDARFEFTTVRW